MNEPNKAFHLTFGNNPPRTMFLRLYKSFGFHVDFYVSILKKNLEAH